MISYIESNYQNNFKSFKYNGGSDSLSYEYLWSPLAEKLLTITPSSIAPNTITLFSLIMLAVVHFLYMFTGDNSNGPEGWKLWMMGLTILIYQNLDNLDGKQARKTKSSSPLGMLFDHGTDAIVSFLLALQMQQFLQLSNPYVKIFLTFVMIMMIYFCAMWSQYSIGYFRLGLINPVDQGLPCYALAIIIGSFLPKNFWLTETQYGCYNTILAFSLCLLVLPIIYYMVKDVFKQPIRSISDILYATFLPIIFLACLTLTALLKPIVYEQALYPLTYLLLFTWCRNMIHMQVCFVTQQKYDPFNIGTFCFVIHTLIYLLVDVNPVTYYWYATFISGLIFFEFVISVLLQGSTLLQIRIFSLKKVNKQKYEPIDNTVTE